MGVIDAILGKDPELRSLEFIRNREVREALAGAYMELADAQARAARTPAAAQLVEVRREISDIEQRIDGLVEEARKHLIRFTFAALEPEEFDELKGHHRPTDKQQRDARNRKEQAPDWNLKTFPPVLVAAACIKVETPEGDADGLSLEDAQAIWSSRSYNEAERNELFNTALEATITRTRIDLPKVG